MYNFQAMPVEDPQKFMAIIIVLSLWELFWKGKALWRAAQKNERNWFIVILVANTLGILPIIYLNFNLPKISRKK
jgi:hypothetical protein